MTFSGVEATPSSVQGQGALLTAPGTTRSSAWDPLRTPRGHWRGITGEAGRWLGRHHSGNQTWLARKIPQFVRWLSSYKPAILGRRRIAMFDYQGVWIFRPWRMSWRSMSSMRFLCLSSRNRSKRVGSWFGLVDETQGLTAIARTEPRWCSSWTLASWTVVGTRRVLQLGSRMN